MKSHFLVVCGLAIAVVGLSSCARPDTAKTEPAPSEPIVQTSSGETTDIAVPDLPGMAEPAAGAEASTAPAAAQAAQGKAVLPDVVARIGDEVITRDQFQTAVANLKSRIRANAMEQSGGQANIPEDFELPTPQIDYLITGMVNEKVLLMMAKQAQSPVSDEEVQKRYDESKAQFPSGQSLDEAMAAAGITENDLKGMIRDRLTVQKFVEEKTKDVTVSEEEIAAEYKRLNEDGKLQKSATVDFAHIVVRASAGDEQASSAAKTKIEEARNRIVSGADFGVVAKEVSEDVDSIQDGGVYRDIAKGGFVSEVLDYAFTGPLGKVSEPIRSAAGWHIVTVLARREPTTYSPAETHDGIQEGIHKKKAYERLGKALEEGKQTLEIQVFVGSQAVPGGPTTGEEPLLEEIPAPQTPEETETPAPAESQAPAASQ